MASKYLQKYPVPEGFHQILHDFSREVLRDQPDDIIKYGADYFESMAQGKEFKFESKYNIAKGEAPGRVHKPPKPSDMTEKAKIVVEKSNNRPDSQQVKRVGSGNPNNISHASSQGSYPEEKKAAKEYVNDLYDKITKDIDDYENPNIGHDAQIYQDDQIDQDDQNEELPKLTSFDDKDVQNIIKIQAAAKGKIARSQVNKNQKKQSKEDFNKMEQNQNQNKDEKQQIEEQQIVKIQQEEDQQFGQEEE
ncbi:unnamed protein product [Paramecium pentaurelia]|uniref:RIIa domain-containing protein n=1 Tax=Paramecium pentaurelia TaxID=43138 RepID=A0A8S1XQR6_9CILI|nr:unnamed protein product [Paramecium pentaurelia]